MPHVIVKVRAGKSEEQKRKLAESITRDVVEHMDTGVDAVSVAIEEIEPERWKDDVYTPEIMSAPEKLYKKPGYTL
ncbi:tautomerase family protein [uncultured Martelella sp.]|uniref:tautomerase family protein n=1 Tax=uncultured Martelella sp. TaxID=392331 RepID=UPI0029C717CC|nr:tautomerase family protein [uncultured Martelella sp.]